MIETNQPKYEISKLDGARRLIHATIRMIFESEDALAVNLLVQSADRVLSDLIEENGLDDVIWNSGIVKTEHIKSLRDFVRRPSNFLKHADQHPEEKLGIFEVGPFSESSLYLAILRYRHLASSFTSHMKFFIGYYLMRNPTHGEVDEQQAQALTQLAALESDITKLRHFWRAAALKELSYATEKIEDCRDAVG